MLHRSEDVGHVKQDDDHDRHTEQPGKDAFHDRDPFTSRILQTPVTSLGPSQRTPNQAGRTLASSGVVMKIGVGIALRLLSVSERSGPNPLGVPVWGMPRTGADVGPPLPDGNFGQTRPANIAPDPAARTNVHQF